MNKQLTELLTNYGPVGAIWFDGIWDQPTNFNWQLEEQYALIPVSYTHLEEAFDVENEENNEIFWSIQFNSAAVEDPVKDGSYQQAQFGACLLYTSEGVIIRR